MVQGISNNKSTPIYQQKFWENTSQTSIASMPLFNTDKKTKNNTSSLVLSSSTQSQTSSITNNMYTVQCGEDFYKLLKRSLIAQGKVKTGEEPTKEQMQEAEKEFKAQNPKGTAWNVNSKGVTYLMVGAKVKIAGGLKDKNNATQQIAKYEKNNPQPPKPKKETNGKYELLQNSKYVAIKSGSNVYYRKETNTVRGSVTEQWKPMAKYSNEKITQNKNGTFTGVKKWPNGDTTTNTYNTKGQCISTSTKKKKSNTVCLIKYQYNDNKLSQSDYFENNHRMSSTTYYNNEKPLQETFFNGYGGVTRTITHNRDGSYTEYMAKGEEKHYDAMGNLLA